MNRLCRSCEDDVVAVGNSCEAILSNGPNRDVMQEPRISDADFSLESQRCPSHRVPFRVSLNGHSPPLLARGDDRMKNVILANSHSWNELTNAG